MKRRTFLKGAGVAGAVGLGAMAFPSSASAQVETGMFGVQESYSINSESGRIESLTLQNISFVASWDNFDAPVAGVDWTLSVSLDGHGSQVIGTASRSDISDSFSSEEPVTASTPAVDLVEVFGQDAFEVGSTRYNGEDVSEQFDLTFSLTATVTDVDGNAESETVTGDTDLGITNLGGNVGAGGDGELIHSDETAEVQYPNDPWLADSQASSGGSFWNTSGENSEAALSPGDTFADLESPGQPIYVNTTSEPIEVEVNDGNDGSSVTLTVGPYDPSEDFDNVGSEAEWVRIPTGIGTPHPSGENNYEFLGVEETENGYRVNWTQV